MICAALGGAAHLLAGKVEAAGGFAQLLVGLDLLDPPPQPHAGVEQQPHSSSATEGAAAGTAASGQAGHQPTARPWWHEYLPIKKVGAMLTAGLKWLWNGPWAAVTSFEPPLTCWSMSAWRVTWSLPGAVSEPIPPSAPRPAPPWLQMSEEEWERYKSQQDDAQRKR